LAAVVISAFRAVLGAEIATRVRCAAGLAMTAPGWRWALFSQTPSSEKGLSARE